MTDGLPPCPPHGALTELGVPICPTWASLGHVSNCPTWASLGRVSNCPTWAALVCVGPESAPAGQWTPTPTVEGVAAWHWHGSLGGRSCWDMHASQGPHLSDEVHQLMVTTACHDAGHGSFIRERCLRQFQEDMETLGQSLWCDWGRTIRSYEALTQCTRQVASSLNCFWPNAEVDRFFVAVHQQYFRTCPATGRALSDPPNSVLCPFLVVPVLLTLGVTMLVVWQSQPKEGIV
ncbi:PREDICTED: receptor activity-modifying protein 1-like [Elephantulus edwardii]|uniref:receptor activity-modifying protein 1-like n=1 Tax=Elephantulus edwardii TaxID=28737 RepID=UPI0003F07AC0|nr:PREDICTED: receptor activity-modifying protein 1-like [Elephantulus edwardii]